MTMDISNFYLMTPLKRPEYIKVKISDIPDEIIKEYNLMEKVNGSGAIYIKAVRGMYGLPQAGLLANELLASTGTSKTNWYLVYGPTRHAPSNFH